MEPAGLPLRPADASLPRRLAVYRVNARENFASALANAYPVLLNELGAEEFRSLAWSYQQAHPSPSGNLYEAGRALPQWLAPAVRGSERAYLADLARLEWAVQEALVAADSSARFDPCELAAVPAGRHGALSFGLHPSVRVVRPTHAVFSIWQRCQNPAQAGRGDVPAGRDERILVRRAGEGIELFLLDELECLCLERFLAGDTLDAVSEAALALVATPDLGAVLVRWATRGIVTHVRLPAGVPG
jgi:hypothetical protein